MKLATTVLFAAVSGAVGCSHNQPPPTASATPPSAPSQTALVATAEPADLQLAPGGASIPKGPQVAPPYAPVAKPAELRPVASSSLASPPPDSLPSVAPDPIRDQPETSADAESVREIRALLAADKSLSATARKITIVARKGRVQLTGQVNTAEERAAIERSARKAGNVIDVKNQLVVME